MPKNDRFIACDTSLLTPGESSTQERSQNPADINQYSLIDFS